MVVETHSVCNEAKPDNLMQWNQPQQVRNAAARDAISSRMMMMQTTICTALVRYCSFAELWPVFSSRMPYKPADS